MLQRETAEVPKHDLIVECVLLDGLRMSLGKIHSLCAVNGHNKRPEVYNWLTACITLALVVLG